MFHVRSLLFDDRRELRYLELDRSTFHCEQCITWWNPFFAIRRLWRLWDDKWLERSWEHERSVTRREDGYFLLLSIPSTPLLSFSLLLLLLLLSLPFEMSSTRLEGNRHKAINFVVWEYRICCLPSPPSSSLLSSKRQRGSTTVLWLYFSCNRYSSNLRRSPDENAFIKCDVNKW